MYGPSEYGFFMEQIRKMFTVIDSIIYSLISAVYQIFYNIASSTLMDGSITRILFTRIQLILGIFILFKLSISLINGIINPDSLSDKQGGFSKIITRVVVSMLLLVTIIPLNLPDSSVEAGSYQSQLNNNGILFGTLYEFQNRVLSEDVLGKIIINNTINMGSDEDNKQLANFGNHLASNVLKAFVTVNLTSEDVEEKIKSDEDYKNDKYLACPDDVETVKTYLDTFDVRSILDFTKEQCGDDYFVFNYGFLISSIAGVLFLIIMAGFTLDIAIRAFKLVILRIIAPIPIISYIDSKSENGVLNAWGKAVGSTYLDVFLRIAIVDFIIFIIDAFTNTGVLLNVSTGPIGIFSWLFLILGLLYFAKQAPKFIMESMGFKYEGGFFSGFGKILGAAAVGLGAIGAARTNYQTAKGENEQLHPGENKRNVGRNVLSGIGGALGGFATGAKAATNADKDHAKAARDAMMARNAQRMSHSTGTGRLADSLFGLTTGTSPADLGNQQLEYYNNAFDKIKSWKGKINDEAIKNGQAYNTGLVDNNNKAIIARYSEIQAALNAGADADGNVNINGQKIAASKLGTDVMGAQLDMQTKDWMDGNTQAGMASYVDSITGTGKLRADYDRNVKAVNDAGLEENGVKYTAVDILGDATTGSSTYGNLGLGMGVSSRAAAKAETDMKQRMRNANKQNNK